MEEREVEVEEEREISSCLSRVPLTFTERDPVCGYHSNWVSHKLGRHTANNRDSHGTRRRAEELNYTACNTNTTHWMKLLNNCRQIK